MKYCKKKLLLSIGLLLVFVVSTFNIGKVFADTNIFKLIDATISDKSEGTLASITSFDDSYPLKSDITVYDKWDENECTHFGVDSWDTIYSNITNGNADMYPVGCSKKISMGTDNDNNSFQTQLLEL